MSAFKRLLEECDAHLKAGESQKVALRLGELNTARVPREFRLPLAKISTRAGLTSLGLKLLTPVVREDRQSPPTPYEVAEYGLLLQRNGSIQEALSTLSAVPGVPEALFYQALCHFSRWDYRAAIPLLLQYQNAALAPYARAVAEINLAAAFVAVEDSAQALRWLEPVITSARAAGQARLLGNGLELRAQVYIQNSEHARARADLDQATSLFAQDGTSDRLFVEKWSAYLAALEKQSPDPVREFRARAAARQHWESVREADLMTLRLDFNHGLFAHLMFGTPYVAYRERVAATLKRKMPTGMYRLGHAEQSCLDVREGTLDGEPILNPGKKIHQLVDLLTRDLYRPSRLGGLFAELFPGEYFNVFSSPARVHQIVRRTRRWIEARGLDLKLVGRIGAYSLTTTGGLALHLPLDRGALGSESTRWQELSRLYPNPNESFTAGEARRALSMPRASFNRLTQWAEKQGLLRRTGSGNRIKYQKVPVSRLSSSAS